MSVSAVDLSGQAAIVTGANGAIGRAITRHFKKYGASVAGLDLVAGNDDLDWFSACDVSDDRAVDSAITAVASQFGRIDILVNNAGIAAAPSAIADTPPPAWRRVIEVNLTGSFLCCRAVVPHMLSAGYGRIVNIGSYRGRDAPPRSGAYSASKAGLVALTRTLGLELAQSNILVNCIAPTAIDAGMSDDGEDRDWLVGRIPLGRFGTPDEVASMTVWLSSPACSFSTGAVFDLSGGRAAW